MPQWFNLFPNSQILIFLSHSFSKGNIIRKRLLQSLTFMIYTANQTLRLEKLNFKQKQSTSNL
jgi:hypothetical protein